MVSWVIAGWSMKLSLKRKEFAQWPLRTDASQVPVNKRQLQNSNLWVDASPLCYGVLVTLSITTPWLGTEDAVYEPLNVPRSLWLHRSRAVAAPVGMPSALH